MKIHLIRSPEYETKNLNEVCQLLSSYKGPLEFEMNGYEFAKDEFYFLQYALYPFHNFKFKSGFKKTNFIKDFGYPLSWEELFSLCSHFRRKFNINKNDFVFLLTYRVNSLNWFSHCNEERNGFIHAADWDKYYVQAHHKYPVAYQVIENVIQNLMKIETIDGPGEFVHFYSMGCINDFCLDKRQVILKLRTADICSDCFKRILKMKIRPDLIDQVLQILEGLRAQFLFKKGINRIAGPFSIVIDENFKLLIPQLGNKELILEPLFSTLYILLLKYPEGIRLKDLSDHNKELKNIYKKMNPNLSKTQIDKSIYELTKPISGSFSQKKSKINKKITAQLGETISRQFQITGNRGEPFRISLSPDNTDIRF